MTWTKSELYTISYAFSLVLCGIYRQKHNVNITLGYFRGNYQPTSTFSSSRHVALTLLNFAGVLA